MPSQTRLDLSAAARTTLGELRDHGPKAYLRERAAVLLAVANGASLRAAAAQAGLKPHHVETVWSWVMRYRQHGLVGLWIGKGRGRKPASFPARPRHGA
jgi:Helix-turn-helix domain